MTKDFRGAAVRSGRTAAPLPWFPSAVFGLALALRLLPVLLTPNLGISLDDMYQYDMLGRSLASGNGFRWYAPQDLDKILAALRTYAGVDTSQMELPTDARGILTSFRAPLYPLFLALIYRLSGLQARFFAARLAQAFVTATVAPMTYALARRLQAGEQPARVAAVIPAVWPFLVALPLALATENLFIPLVLAGLLTMMAAWERRRSGDFLLAGALLGLATLTRSVIVGFPALAALALWRRGERRGAALLLSALAVLVVPWCVRNTLLHGRLTLVESSLGYNLYLGYHPEGDGSFLFGPSLDLVTILDDAQRDAVGKARALQFIEDDPGRVPWLMIQKLRHFWGLEDRAFIYLYSNGLFGQLPSWAAIASYLVLILPLPLLAPWAALGLVLGWRAAQRWAIHLLLLWLVGVHVLIMAEERFHLPLVPVLAVLAAQGASLWPDLRARLRQGDRAARRPLAAATALVALAALSWGFELAASAPTLAVLFGPHGASAGFHY